MAAGKLLHESDNESDQAKSSQRSAQMPALARQRRQQSRLSVHRATASLRLRSHKLLRLGLLHASSHAPDVPATKIAVEVETHLESLYARPPQIENLRIWSGRTVNKLTMMSDIGTCASSRAPGCTRV